MTGTAPFVFRAETPLLRLLAAAQSLPGYFGRSARRKLLRRYGRYSVAAFDGFLGRIGPQDAVLDLGANEGVFTTKLAATGAMVHAYEPDPEAFARLTRAVAGLANVRLYNAAVAARPGLLRLSRKKRAAGGHDTVASSIVFDNRGKDGGGSDGVEVEVVGFAEALARCGQRVALVKMDIEGAEFDILEQVFAAPAAFDFDAMFVETHERIAPEKTALIDRLRREAAGLPQRYVNLYWP